MNATPQYLLKGSYYALIQCGRLLNRAATLYKAGDHVTAVGLAALAQEELGRSRYLRDQWKEVVKGKTVSLREIRKACENHLLKQKWGQVSVVQDIQAYGSCYRLSAAHFHNRRNFRMPNRI
jgi:AbiV family abortive infection protein